MASKGGGRDHSYAVGVVGAICELAGEPSYVDDLRADLREHGVIRAVTNYDTPRLFGWLMSILSYQGISNRVAEDFIHKHGNVSWSEIKDALAETPACPKLGGYWRFNRCRYHKTSESCTEPGHIAACPLPRHPLRNGRLNQMAYSLFLFIRDIADGDLVGWIDDQLALTANGPAADYASAHEALIGPLRNVSGVSDKVLAMTLSTLLMGAGNRKQRWFNAGASLVVIDTPLFTTSCTEPGFCIGSMPSIRMGLPVISRTGVARFSN
jgi:hypothetical protein